MPYKNLQLLDEQIAEQKLSSLEIDKTVSSGLEKQGISTVGEAYGLQSEGIALALAIDYPKAERFWKDLISIISNPDRWEQPTYATTCSATPNIFSRCPSEYT